MQQNKLFAMVSLFLFLTGCGVTVSEYKSTPRDLTAKYTSKSSEDIDYDTSSYVIKTRGDGEIACINLGSNDGIEKGTKVEFYTLEKDRGEKYEVVFARGMVFQVSPKTAWVLVKDPENAQVKVNHFVRKALDQTKTFGENINSWFEWLFG